MTRATDYWDPGVPRPLWKPWPNAPELVVNDGGHGVAPSSGTNPSNYTSTGEMYVAGDMVFWRADYVFGASFAKGSGPYRTTLPYPVDAAWRSAVSVVGGGHLYHDDTVGAFLGLGPSSHHSVEAHVTTGIATDAAGIVIGSNLPSTLLQNGSGGTGYTLSGHSDLRTMNEGTITLINLAHVVGTILNDLGILLSENGLDNLGDSSPYVMGPNDGIFMQGFYKRA